MTATPAANSARRPRLGDPPGDPPDDAAVDELLLRAAREEVVAVGLHRATASAVARRAGLDRVTLYRRSGGVKRLILRTITHELEELIAPLPGQLNQGTGRERTTELCLALMEGFASSEFLRVVLAADLTLLEPYLTAHLGTGQRSIIRCLATEIERGIEDGSIAPQDPRILATVLLQALTPFATAATIADLELGRDATVTQLRRLIGGYLATPDPIPPE